MMRYVSFLLLMMACLLANAQRSWILGSNVILRAEPTRKSAEVARLQMMDAVEKIGESEQREVIAGAEYCDDYGYPWVKVTTEAGKTGWVFGKYIYTQSSEGPSAEMPGSGPLQIVHADDHSQGPANEEGIIECETLTLLLVADESGAAKPISMANFLHLNEFRMRNDGQESASIEWLMLNSNSGYVQSISGLEATEFEGRPALRMSLSVGYQEGGAEHVLILEQSSELDWFVVEYQVGEFEHPHD